MYKIIKQKRYGTETSTPIGEIATASGVAILYQKRTGEFFLYTKSGDEETIIPLQYVEAERWAKQNASPEKYKEKFGAIPDDNSKQYLTVVVKACNLEKLERAAAKSERAKSEIIDKLIEENLQL